MVYVVLWKDRSEWRYEIPIDTSFAILNFCRMCVHAHQHKYETGR
jgi:hypothetical protein